MGKENIFKTQFNSDFVPKINANAFKREFKNLTNQLAVNCCGSEAFVAVSLCRFSAHGQMEEQS